MGPNEQAARGVVTALRALGRLEPINEARVIAFIQLACSVDDEPSSPGLWKNYREAEICLREMGDGDNALDNLLSSLRDTTPA